MFDSNGVVFDDNVSCLMTNSAVVCSVSRARVHFGEFCVLLSRVYTHMLPCEVPDEIRYSIRIYLINIPGRYDEKYCPLQLYTYKITDIFVNC